MYTVMQAEEITYKNIYKLEKTSQNFAKPELLWVSRCGFQVAFSVSVEDDAHTYLIRARLSTIEGLRSEGVFIVLSVTPKRYQPWSFGDPLCQVPTGKSGFVWWQHEIRVPIRGDWVHTFQSIFVQTPYNQWHNQKLVHRRCYNIRLCSSSVRSMVISKHQGT